MMIKWLGHSSFEVEAEGKVIHFDPYILPWKPRKADIIFITHEHSDHADVDIVKLIRKTDTAIVTVASAADRFRGNVVVVKPGDMVTVKDVAVHVVHAYDTDEIHHAKGEGVGFILELEGKYIYHAGDTDFIPEMHGIEHIDVAMLSAGGGRCTIEGCEAARIAALVNPNTVIPMHHGTFEEDELDLVDFKRRVESVSHSHVELMRQNDELFV